MSTKEETVGQFLKRCQGTKNHHYSSINLQDELKKIHGLGIQWREFSGVSDGELIHNRDFWCWQFVRRNPKYQEAWNIISAMDPSEERNEAIFSFNEDFGLGELAVTYFRKTKEIIDPEFFSPLNDFVDTNMEFSYAEGKYQGIEWYQHPDEVHKVIGSTDKNEGGFQKAEKYVDFSVQLKETDFLVKIDLEKAVDLKKTLDLIRGLVRYKQREYGLIHVGNGSRKTWDNYDQLYWTSKDIEMGLKCFDLKILGRSNSEIKKVLFSEAKTDANKVPRYIEKIIPFINDPYSLPPANHNES